MESSPRSAAYRSLYRQNASSHHGRVRKAGWIEAVRSAGEAINCRHALEFGCGVGEDAAELLTRTTWRITGVDFAPEALDRAPAGMTRLLADVRELRPDHVPGAPFDLIYCAFLVHLLETSEKLSFFKLVADLLTNRGVFLCLTASEDDLRRRQIGRHFPSALELDLRRYLPTGQIVEMLRIAGLKNVAVAPVHLADIYAPDCLRWLEARANSIFTVLPKDEVARGVESLRHEVETELGRGHDLEPRSRPWIRTMISASR